MNQTEINNIELAPIGVTNTDVLSIYERVLNRTKAALNSMHIALRADHPEADTTFQRAMLSVTGRQRFNPANTQHFHAEVGTYDGTPRELGAAVEGPASSERRVIRSKQQLRTLYHLLHAESEDGIPASELAALVGAGNQWDVVHQLRQKVGKDVIQRTDLLVKNKTGKTTHRANYWLTSEGKQIAADILQRSGYVHDAASDIGHIRRPGVVAYEFLAVSPIDHDDLMFLRDGTKAQWVRLVYLLHVMNGEWVPRYVADELLDSLNVRQVVCIANMKLGGQAIESATRHMTNRDGGVCDYGLYRLAEGWGDVVGKAIREVGLSK